jgi:NTP pyrophosphatase (non-canonical NTP hydrolase)
VPDLTELQRAIVAERRSRGFTTDPLQVFTLLVEEVGEVARELKRTWSPNYDDLSVERLAPELADILTLLAALADGYGIDLATAVDHKFFQADAARSWPSAPDP